MIQFVIPGNPGSKARARFGGGKRPRKPDSAAERGVSWHIRQQLGPIQPLDGPIGMRVWFYRKDRRVVDADNLLKRVWDAGNRIAWVDDRMIRECHFWLDYDAESPRTEVEAWIIESR